MLTWQNTGDPCTPETLTFVNHLMPTRIGYTTALGPYAFSSNNTEITMAANTGYSPRGLSYFDSTGAQQFIFTLSNKIFRYPNNTDISRGVAYTNGYFSFAQYRDKIYAVNGADLLQKSTTGAFADVASTPKLTRIAVNGEYMAGINLVANFTLSEGSVTASAYRIMISGVGNPEQFDYTVDTTAFSQDIVNTGGPLTAISTWRDMFVVFQKSGVYVLESTGNPADPWAIRLVSDYYGCEWPDSVIEVNNVLYWISPTRFGEVCAFDGAQISVLSGALHSTYIDRFTVYANDAGFGAPTAGFLEGPITVGTDGESIVWNKATFSNTSPLSVFSSQLYMNIATGRFGFSGNNASGVNGIMLCCSNAAQNGLVSVLATDLTAGASKYKAAYLAQYVPASVGTTGAELFRANPSVLAKISNMQLSFSEQLAIPPNVSELSSAISGLAIASARARPAWSGTPTLQWTSAQAPGLVENKTETTALTIPTGAWNSTTASFNIGPATARSQSAKAFGFKLAIFPVNSLTAIDISFETAGTSEAKAKAGSWR